MALLLKLSICTFLFASVNSVPPTCYSRVVQLGEEITERTKDFQNDPTTKQCTEHFPKMYVDIHNSCSLSKMRDYLYLLENLTDRSCFENQNVQSTMHAVRQLQLILGQKCQGEIVFYSSDCTELEKKAAASS
ncbi:CYTL1 domain-containing protein [Latimeria chalumnae]|uniref:Cytokine-like protein 1 n=1 Tax=Latimeria chalumnae TaxID=7897 RepID=M3XH56_LATCH|nr:PREDICTED: cytokine-like protein 1 [Latimeria chalumnae]|eukprot:XP_006010141.1 PREDICTED: cytokine-like protein 1 [Latimeria chalumnae]